MHLVQSGYGHRPDTLLGNELRKASCVYGLKGLCLCAAGKGLFTPHDFDRLENQSIQRRWKIPLAEVEEFIAHLSGDSRNDLTLRGTSGVKSPKEGGQWWPSVFSKGLSRSGEKDLPVTR